MREWAWRKTTLVQLLVPYRSWTSFVGCLLHVDKADGLDSWRELLKCLGLKAAKLKLPTAPRITHKSEALCAQ